MKFEKYKVMVADDEENVRVLLKEILEGEGYEVFIAEDGGKALDVVSKNTLDCALLDVRMPVLDGLEAFLKIKEISPELPVIFLTAYGSSDLAIKAMKKGAYDYLTKPFDVEELRIKVKKAIDLRKITMNTKKVKQSFDYIEDEIIGDSPQMQEVYKEVGKVAGSDATILLRGESGTGKELFAKAIYLHSNRKDNPFLIVNCAAIPETLLESELFGHEKGSFTDAISKHIGKFEAASNGTIFLDEIGDMSLSLQSKLLRVLQEKTFNRVGSTETITSDVRVIAATNRDLERLVKNGEFREDLYYRLNVVTITIPPLRDRKEDIPLLVSYFVAKYSKKYNKSVQGVDKELIEMFINYNWPGNVRELENVIARGVIITSAPFIMKEHLPKEFIGQFKTEEEKRTDLAHKKSNFKNITYDELTPLPELIEAIEKQQIIKALDLARGNKTKAAKMLGISRKSLFNKLRQYNIPVNNSE
jgi:two-component system response regulator AtoC